MWKISLCYKGEEFVFMKIKYSESVVLEEMNVAIDIFGESP